MEEYMEDNSDPDSGNMQQNQQALSVCQLVRLAADAPPLDDNVSTIKNLTTFRGRIFECFACEYSTGNLDSLKRHNKCHQTSKEFMCKFCSFSSNSNSQVSRHQKSHHQSHHLDAENENTNCIEKDLEKVDEELCCQLSPSSPPQQEKVCSTTKRLNMEKSSLNPNLSSAGRKRPSFKKKKSSVSSSSKKTLKRGILGLSINSRIARFKSKLNKNDSVPHCCEIVDEEDTYLGSDQHTMEGEETSMQSEILELSASSQLPDLEQDFMEHDDIESSDSPPELSAMVNHNTSEENLEGLVVNKDSEGSQSEVVNLKSSERLKNQEAGPQSQGLLPVDTVNQTPKAIPGNNLVMAMQDSTMDVIILNPHQSESISTEEGSGKIEQSVQSGPKGPKAFMELEKEDPSHDIQVLDGRETKEKEVSLETNASENDLNKQYWERNSQLLKDADELIKLSTVLHRLATQISRALPNLCEKIDALKRELQSLIGKFNADVKSDRITMERSLAFLRRKQQLRCEIENKALQAHSGVDAATDAARAAEETLALVTAKGNALRMSIQKMCGRKSDLEDTQRNEWIKGLAALDTATDSTSEAFAAECVLRQITIDSIKKEAKQLKTELLPLYQQESFIRQEEQRASESFIAASEQLVAKKIVLQALQLELSNLLNQADSDNHKDLEFIEKKNATYGKLNICLRNIQLLK